MSYSYELRQQMHLGAIKEVFPLKVNSKYEKGKSYWCGYWQQYYTVIEVVYSTNGLKSVTVLWQNGEQTTHCTNLDSKKDFEIKLGGDVLT